ncbi:MAG: hypothetical protein Tsb005_18810 [Gammaproteobacteria bacterium]
MNYGIGFKMTDDLYKNLAQAEFGYVEAPAGCGKTEAIVHAVTEHAKGKQLILTHTNAGVAALKKRFVDKKVPNEKYNIETIAGWAWKWVRKYPINSAYSVTDLPENWIDVYRAANRLMEKQFVQYVIKNSYYGVIVDEYQDCTQSMHELMLTLKKILPCRILGDPLQGIFEFSKNNNDPLVAWDIVKNDFVNDLGRLSVPYRWEKANNKALGKWLISNRNLFRNNEPVQFNHFNHSPITTEIVDNSRISLQLINIARNTTKESVCIIGPKYGKLNPGLLTTAIKQGFSLVESQELPEVKKLVEKISNNSPIKEKAEAAFNFVKTCFSGLGKHKDFIERILLGTLSKPKSPDRKEIYEKFNNGYEHELLLALLNYLDKQNDIYCIRKDSIFCLTNLVSAHIKTQEDLISIFSKVINARKYSNYRLKKKVIGTTLLLKGLEFDNSVVIHNGKNWGTNKDLYVAITRGSKAVKIIQTG